MGKKVAFATTNYSTQPERSSGFSGFPFPVFFARKWTGQYSKPLSQYQQELQNRYDQGETYPISSPVEVEAGWLEYDPSSTWVIAKFIYPDVVVPAGAPAGCTISRNFRPLIFEGGPYLGPFSKEDVTRLWWTARSLRVQNMTCSASASSNISADFRLRFSSTDDSSLSRIFTASSSVNLTPSFSNGGATNPDSEVDAKLTNVRPFDHYRAIAQAVDSGRDSDEYVGDDLIVFAQADAASNASASAFISFYNNEVVCDIDSPNDFYIKFFAEARVEASTSCYFRWGYEDILGYYFASYQDVLTSSSDFIEVYQMGPRPFEYTNTNYSPFYVYGGDTYMVGATFTGNECLRQIKVLRRDQVGATAEAGCSDSSPKIVTVVNATFNFFDGKSLSFKIYGIRRKSSSEDDGYDEASFQENVSLSEVSFYVKEYYEYDDGNGNPIYNKDTGAILRDPITGQPNTNN
jgi:hypothetical protein